MASPARVPFHRRRNAGNIRPARGKKAPRRTGRYVPGYAEPASHSSGCPDDRLAMATDRPVPVSPQGRALCCLTSPRRLAAMPAKPVAGWRSTSRTPVQHLSDQYSRWPIIGEELACAVNRIDEEKDGHIGANGWRRFPRNNGMSGATVKGLKKKRFSRFVGFATESICLDAD